MLKNNSRRKLFKTQSATNMKIDVQRTVRDENVKDYVQRITLFRDVSENWRGGKPYAQEHFSTKLFQATVRDELEE